ncbi:MAG: queuosine precursor transporter [Gammaproteobacteria bacterium]|nr:queuosine precursor transporter [Gammaproteobacteria bacterium]
MGFSTLIQWLELNQELLWIITIAVDLSFAIILFRFFGRQGLYATIIISLLLANLQGPKLTEIFGLQTSMGVILYSSIYFATDLLSERYGKLEATRAVMIGFTVSIIIIVMISISLIYLPASAPETASLALSMHEATATLFNFTPRFVLGSLLAYLLSQRFDVWVFHAIKEKTNGRHLWLRNNISTMLSQAIDTIVYGVVVWWGVVDLTTAMQLALAKYLFKILIALLDTPFIYLARGWDVEDKDWVIERGIAK